MSQNLLENKVLTYLFHFGKIKIGFQKSTSQLSYQSPKYALIFTLPEKSNNKQQFKNRADIFEVE